MSDLVTADGEGALLVEDEPRRLDAKGNDPDDRNGYDGTMRGHQVRLRVIDRQIPVKVTRKNHLPIAITNKNYLYPQVYHTYSYTTHEIGIATSLPHKSQLPVAIPHKSSYTHNHIYHMRTS